MMIKITATGVSDVSAAGTPTKIEVLRHVDGPLDDSGVTLATNRMGVMGQAVVTDTTTVFDNVAVGSLVDLAAIDNLAKAGGRPELEIHGIADNTGTIHATFIRMWFDNVVTGRDVQVKGTVGNDNVSGKTFTLGTSTVSYAVRPAGLDNDVFVEVKGTFRTSDNPVLATTVTVPASPANSLNLFGKTVSVNTLTQYKDSRDGLRTFGPANILTGDTLRVSAFLDSSAVSDRIVASRVERIDAFPTNDRHILQGNVEIKFAGVSLTILGVNVRTFPGTTEFLQADGTPFPGATPNDRQANFFAAVIEGRTVVKARGTAGSPSVFMTANELQVQPAIDN
jgi:hypothetical protein